MPTVDVERFRREDRQHAEDQVNPIPYRFAAAIDTNLTLENSGTWEMLANGDKIWRLKIKSKGAKNLNLGFTQFELPEGAKLWMYNQAGNRIEGPYLRKHRSAQGQLWTPVIRAEVIIVELFVPANVPQEPRLTIGKVNHGYRSFLEDEQTGPDKGNQGSCNIDTVCQVADPWRDQVRSVAKYTINGTKSCTGQLLNNTGKNLKPYFLSAFHCGVDSSNSGSLVFYWNFQAANCGDLDNGNLADNQTGALFRAGWADSDFLLLELVRQPDFEFNVFYAGWDATGETPLSSVAIHHPRGDEKAISLDNDPLISTNYLGNERDENADHWRVIDWDLGTTEGGSSGSCLWDQDNSRCVGQLHGGFASCDNQSSDWYGKLSVSWEGGGTAITRLREWLSPDNNGIIALDGLDPVVVHYQFDQSQNRGLDSSTRNNHGQLLNAFVDEGIIEAGMLANGTNNLVEFRATVPDLNLTGAVTGIAWIKPSGKHTADNNPSSCKTGTLFQKGGNLWLQILQDNNGLKFQHAVGDADSVTVNTSIPVDQWTQVAFVRDQNNLVKFYKNGLLVSGGGTLTSSSRANTKFFSIGYADVFAQADGCEFDGRIDEVKIIDGALQADEIKAEYDRVKNPVNHTDTDNDGLTDILEFSSCTKPNDADTDDDGILDGDEDLNSNGHFDANETNPCNADTDGDLLHDGLETGLTIGVSDTDMSVFIADTDPNSTTSPTSSDTDGDGVIDSDEDYNRNGRVDWGETDPGIDSNLLVDGGYEGLSGSISGWGNLTPGRWVADTASLINPAVGTIAPEQGNGMIRVDANNPVSRAGQIIDVSGYAAEIDAGNVWSDFLVQANVPAAINFADGNEWTLILRSGATPNLYGEPKPQQVNNQSEVLFKLDANPSTWELVQGKHHLPVGTRYLLYYFKTKYINAPANGAFFDGASVIFDTFSDSDNDGLMDLLEDNSCTNTSDGDSDDDGILDSEEDINRNGFTETNETDPCLIDSDYDGIQDGTELGLTVGTADTDLNRFIADADPSTTTWPTNNDTDGDSAYDGIEDSNANGAVDPGETDPNNGLDVDPPVEQEVTRLPMVGTIGWILMGLFFIAVNLTVQLKAKS